MLLTTPLLHGQGGPDIVTFNSAATCRRFPRSPLLRCQRPWRSTRVRPCMQELRWQRPSSSTITPSQTDSVKQIMFSFYNDQLSKMVVDYDHERTTGLTDADLIDAISVDYGPRVKPGARTGRGTLTRVEEESGTLVARWAAPITRSPCIEGIAQTSGSSSPRRGSTRWREPPAPRPPGWTIVKRRNAKSPGRRKKPKTRVRHRKNHESRTRRPFGRDRGAAGRRGAVCPLSGVSEPPPRDRRSTDSARSSAGTRRDQRSRGRDAATTSDWSHTS